MTADERLALIRRKIERANTHLKDLEIIRDRFLNSDFYALGSEQHPRPGYENFDVFFPVRVDPVPSEISLLAGDAIHNIRSALDHLACQLVDVFSKPITVSDKTRSRFSRAPRLTNPRLLDR